MKHVKTSRDYMKELDERDRFGFLRRDKTSLTYLSVPVEIRVDIEAISHAMDRLTRHGFRVNNYGKVVTDITKDEIIETIEKSVEEITIDLMHGKFSLYDDKRNLNRFRIYNKKTHLNIICILVPGNNYFTFTVITIMRTRNFYSKIHSDGQYVVNV